MKDKFKVGDEVREDCGCRIKVLKVFKKSYRCIHTTPVLAAARVDVDGDKVVKITDVTHEGNIPFLYYKSMLDEIGIIIPKKEE